MKYTMIKAFAALLAGFLVTVTAVQAQEKATDRRDYIAAEINTTDDPRRIPVPKDYMEPKGTIVLAGGRVFDATGAKARLATVVVKANKISAILSPESKDWPEGAKVVQLGGKTVMPGLIDMHVHMTYSEDGSQDSEADATLRAVERLRYYIESGITTVRDVASMGAVPFRIKNWVKQDRLSLPRVYTAGQLITGTGGHGAGEEQVMHAGFDVNGMIRLASGPDDFREAVRQQFARGADFIKIASHFSEAEIKAAVEEAHELGMKVTVDAETFYIKRAVEAGADIIEHPLPRTKETIKLMAKMGTGSVPTLVPYNLIFDLAGGYWESTSRRFTFSKTANRQMLKDLKKAGVKLGIGTDLVVDWFRGLPNPYIEELREFVNAGFTIPEALIAATRTNAELLAMDDKLGTIEVGKLADITVFDGKPDEVLEHLAKVDLVIRDGDIVVQDGRVYIPRHKPQNVEGWTMLKDDDN